MPTDTLRAPLCAPAVRALATATLCAFALSTTFAQPAPPSLEQQFRATFAGQASAQAPDPFAGLPRDRNGNIVSIERARAMAKTERNVMVRQLMTQFFPAGEKGRSDLWVRETALDGSSHWVPNREHENYRHFINAVDDGYTEIDRHYQANYGDRYREFSREMFRNYDPENAQLIGRAQETIHSDVDVTFHDTDQRDAFIQRMRDQGLTVETDPKGHGLYVRVKELDYVVWGNETVADLRRAYDAAPDEAARRRAGERLANAMKDVEVCATTAGAQRNLLGARHGQIDPVGAKLDHIKKFAQASDVYTKDKIGNKLMRMDLGDDGYARVLRGEPHREPSQILAGHGGEKRALRLEGLPEVLRNEVRATHIEHRKQDIVDSYRHAVVEGMVRDREDRLEREGLVLLVADAERDGQVDLADQYRREIEALDDARAHRRRTNDEAIREIAASDKDLARRLVQVHADALQNLQREDPDSRAVRDIDTRRSMVRAGYDALKRKVEAWAPVVVDASTRLADQTEAVFDKVGKVGAYAAIADQAAALEAAGEGSATAYMAREISKNVVQDKLTDALVKRYPKMGGVLEVLDVPSMMVGNMEKALEQAEARGTSPYTAKLTAIVETIKEKTWIGTAQRILDEEGLAEVDNELATGRYNWGRVAYLTAARTLGETTQFNAIARYGANRYYGVYEAEKAARLETEAMKQKFRAKTLSMDKGLERLRAELIRLQLDADVDDPIVRARIAELEREFDQGVRDLRTLGRKMRNRLGVRDRGVEDAYKRSLRAIEKKDTDLLEARMGRLVVGRDIANPASYVELTCIRKDYRDKLDQARQRLKALHKDRGGDDPLVREMYADFRRMRETANRVDAVQWDSAAWAQQGADAFYAKEREKFAGYQRQIDAQANLLPPGITPDDQALLAEMDELRIRQEAGEVPADANLVLLAGQSLAYELRYRELSRQQAEGEIPLDADLEQMARVDIGAAPPPDPGLTAFAGGDGAPDEAVPVTGAGDTPPRSPTGEYAYHFIGLDSEPAVESIAYVQQAVPGTHGSDAPEKNGTGMRVSRGAGGRVTSIRRMRDHKTHGLQLSYHRDSTVVQRESDYFDARKHGPYREYDGEGRLTRDVSYSDNRKHGPEVVVYYREQKGSLSVTRKITHYKHGKKHGPALEYRDDVLVKEGFYNDGNPALWSRAWQLRDGAAVLKHESLLDASGVKIFHRQFDTRSGALTKGEYFAIADGVDRGDGRMKYPRRIQQFHDGRLISDETYTAEGEKVGVHIRVPSRSDRWAEESTYASPDELTRIVRRDRQGATVLDIGVLQDDAGKRWLHGTVVEHQADANSDYLAQGIKLQARFDNGYVDGPYLRDVFGERVTGAFERGRATGRWTFHQDDRPLAILNLRDGRHHGEQTLFDKGEVVTRLVIEGDAITELDIRHAGRRSLYKGDVPIEPRQPDEVTMQRFELRGASSPSLVIPSRTRPFEVHVVDDRGRQGFETFPFTGDLTQCQ